MPPSPSSIQMKFAISASSGWKRSEARKNKWKRVSHKPGSVLQTDQQSGGWLSIWDDCYQSPLAVSIAEPGKRPTWVPCPLLPTGVYQASASRHCWCALTSPLHPYQSCSIDVQRTPVNSDFGGMFLWHSPRGHPHWALPSKSGLWGARTFLKLLEAKNLQPPRSLSSQLHNNL